MSKRLTKEEIADLKSLSEKEEHPMILGAIINRLLSHIKALEEELEEKEDSLREEIKDMMERRSE